MADSGTATGSDLSADRDSDLSSTSPTSFNSSGYHAFGMQQVATSTPIGRDENGQRRLSANAMAFEPRNLANTETGSDSTESETGPTDWFGLSAPKFGTLIPNRIFVGGISSTTTENDLSGVFGQFGRVLQAKIIMDRAGISKGYGFITFETEAEAKTLCDGIAAKTVGPIMFRERRLTVAPAVKKQIATPITPVVEIAMHSAAHPNMALAGANGYMYYYLPQGPAPGVPFGLPQQQFPMMQQPCVTGGYFHGGAGDPTAFQHAEGYIQGPGFPMQLHQAPAQIPQGHGQVYQIPGPYIQPHTLFPQQYNQPAQPGQYASYLFDGFPPQQVTGQEWYSM